MDSERFRLLLERLSAELDNAALVQRLQDDAVVGHLVAAGPSPDLHVDADALHQADDLLDQITEGVRARRAAAELIDELYSLRGMVATQAMLAAQAGTLPQAAPPTFDRPEAEDDGGDDFSIVGPWPS